MTHPVHLDASNRREPGTDWNGRSRGTEARDNSQNPKTTGSVTRKISEPRSSLSLERRTFAFPVLREGSSRSTLEFSGRNRRGRGLAEEGEGRAEEGGRRKREEGTAWRSVDSGFRQEDVTVNPRPLASDEPTLRTSPRPVVAS